MSLPILNKLAGLFLFVFAISVARANPSSSAYSRLPENDCDVLLTAQLLVSEILTENRFETTRDLPEYKRLFGPNFENALYQLKDGEVWIDMGAGFALAQTQFRELRSARVNLVATGFVRPQLGHMKPDSTKEQIDEYMARLAGLERNLLVRNPMPFRYVEGDILKIRETSMGRKGQVRLITDLFGPMSYAAEPAKLLRLYGNMLSLNARLFIHVLDDRLQIRDPRTKEVYTLFQFVAKYGRGFYFSPESRFLVRDSEEIYIPDLKLVKRLAGTPPYNTYEIIF